MSVIHKAARVFADEGITGLVRRTARKAFGPPPTRVEPLPAPVDPADALAEQLATAKAEFAAQADTFARRCRELGYSGLEDYYWYHAVDLGNGLVTPGDYDFRDHISAFGFPADLSGTRVLDVGSATGYFAFAFERRGADVTSVELPSLADWDMLRGERARILRDLAAYHRADSPEQAYERHIDGPFRFCHKLLNSRVERCYSSVYDLTLAELGGVPFDLVYAGDILMHLFSPFEALDVLAGLTRGSLYVTIETPFTGPAEGALIAFRGLVNGEEGRTWWLTSRSAVEQMLRRLGFRSVEVVGRYSGIARRAWFPYWREVIKATR